MRSRSVSSRATSSATSTRCRTTGSRWAARNASIDRHPTDKDSTDTELALALAATFDPDRITLIGGGDRLDHTIAGIGALGALSVTSVPMLDGGGTASTFGSCRARDPRSPPRARLDVVAVGAPRTVHARHAPQHTVGTRSRRSRTAGGLRREQRGAPVVGPRRCRGVAVGRDAHDLRRPRRRAEPSHDRDTTNRPVDVEALGGAGRRGGGGGARRLRSDGSDSGSGTTDEVVSATRRPSRATDSTDPADTAGPAAAPATRSHSSSTTRSPRRTPRQRCAGVVHRPDRHRCRRPRRRRHRHDALEGVAHRRQSRGRRDVGHRQHAAVAGDHRRRVRAVRRHRNRRRLDLGAESSRRCAGGEATPVDFGDVSRQLRHRLVRRARARPAENARRPDRPGLCRHARGAESRDVVARPRVPARHDPRVRPRRLAGLLAGARGERCRGRRGLDRGLLRTFQLGGWRPHTDGGQLRLESACRGDLRRSAA